MHSPSICSMCEMLFLSLLCCWQEAALCTLKSSEAVQVSKDNISFFFLYVVLTWSCLGFLPLKKGICSKGARLCVSVKIQETSLIIRDIV